jgi:hypothetical protein
MVDCNAIFYQVLTQSGTGLDTLISGRVDYLQTPVGFVNDEARVVYMPEGGAGDVWTPTHERSYLLHCYGGTTKHTDSEAVYRAVHDLLNNLNMTTVASGVMMVGWEEQSGIPLIHPDTKFPLVTCRFSGRFR